MPGLDLGAGPLAFVVAGAVLSGLVRGFAGFGTGLIYVPLASLALPPLWVLVTLTVMDLIGPLPAVPRALREGQPRHVAALLCAAAVTLLPGLLLLDRMDPAGFRWLVGGLCLLTVALMASGWRWSGRMTPAVTLAAGGAAGFLGGLAGLAGPPVVLTFMSSPLPPRVIRANLMVFLVAWDVLFGGVLWNTGRLLVEPVALGALLIAPYLAAVWIGGAIFRRSDGDERLYRRVAYALIAGSAVLALPVWG